MAAVPALTGRTILVTGATSGIGRAAAVKLAGAGATVLVHGRSQAKTEAVAAAIGAEPVVADFARLGDVRRMADEVRRRTGRLDAVPIMQAATTPAGCSPSTGTNRPSRRTT